jgi:hypothetical protein
MDDSDLEFQSDKDKVMKAVLEDLPILHSKGILDVHVTETDSFYIYQPHSRFPP